MPSIQSGRHVVFSALRQWSPLFVTLVLVAATLVVYYPVHWHPFIFLDDRGYVVDNIHIQQLNWDTVKWSFTTFHASNWHPLTWLSHALDYHYFPLEPGRHHDINLLLHTLNAVLLFWVLWQATSSPGPSFMVAALFALHPINVESVAWVAERKNLLSMLFFLLALGAYHRYARSPGTGRYLVVLLAFALGLMSKPQVITLPFVLLLWDYWPLARMFPREKLSSLPAPQAESIPARSVSWLVLEKLPLLLLSVASAIVTMKAQRAGGTMGGILNSYSLAERLGYAVIAYVRYLEYAFWPVHLAFFYPHSQDSLSAWRIVSASLLLLLITWMVIIRRKSRYLIVGWLWFLGTLVPMIGLVQVGSQAMADRYAYLPLIGLFIAVCWGVAAWERQRHLSRIWLPTSAVVVLLLLMLAARRQVNYWSDDLTLWTHSTQVIRNNWKAENMIGEILLRDRDSEGAISHFRAAAVMEPRFPFPHLHIGIYEEEHRHPYAAIEQFNRVLELTQKDADRTPVLRGTALVHMSFAYNELGDFASQERYLNMAAQAEQH
jgi:hypothetical protein